MKLSLFLLTGLLTLTQAFASPSKNADNFKITIYECGFSDLQNHPILTDEVEMLEFNLELRSGSNYKGKEVHSLKVKNKLKGPSDINSSLMMNEYVDVEGVLVFSQKAQNQEAFVVQINRNLGQLSIINQNGKVKTVDCLKR